VSKANVRPVLVGDVVVMATGVYAVFGTMVTSRFSMLGSSVDAGYNKRERERERERMVINTLLTSMCLVGITKNSCA
jgi:hypothetical protein